MDERTWEHLTKAPASWCTHLLIRLFKRPRYRTPHGWRWQALSQLPKATVFNVVTHRLVWIDQIQYIIGTDANNQFKILSLLAKSIKTWSLLIKERMHQFEAARQLRSRSNPLSYAHVWPHWPLWSSACIAQWSRPESAEHTDFVQMYRKRTLTLFNVHVFMYIGVLHTIA